MNNNIYSSYLLSNFIKKVMKRGKKEKFEILIINYINSITRLGFKAFWIFLFFELLTTMKPIVYLKPRILKKKKIYVPIIIGSLQQYKKSIEWLLTEIKINEAGHKLPLKEKIRIYFESIYLQKLDPKTVKYNYYKQVLGYREYKNYRW